MIYLEVWEVVPLHPGRTMANLHTAGAGKAGFLLTHNKTKMKQRNTTARAKRKIKVLKLKAFWKRVFSKRYQKKIDGMKPKGQTITGTVKPIAPHVSEMYPNGEYKRLFAKGAQPLNQRQRRKLAAQNR